MSDIPTKEGSDDNKPDVNHTPVAVFCEHPVIAPRSQVLALLPTEND